jgi:hypothetical protein
MYFCVFRIVKPAEIANEMLLSVPRKGEKFIKPLNESVSGFVELFIIFY